MATITGANLLQQILTDRQVTIVNQKILAARLQKMLDSGMTDLSIAAALAANTTIKASVSAGNPAEVLTVLIQSVTEAKDKIDDGSDPGPEPVDTFKLTAGKDVATANVFNADRTWTPSGTDQVNSLNDDDVLTGTGTNPRLNFEFVSDADIGDAVVTPTLQGIEIINIELSNSIDGTSTLDLQDAQGVRAINVSRIADGKNATVRNIADAVTDLSIVNSQAAGSNVTFSFLNTAVVGEADSINVKLSNVDVNQILIQERGTTPTNGFETINLDSVGNDNQINQLLAEGLSTLSIVGSGQLTLGGVALLAGTQDFEATHYNPGLANVATSLTEIDAAAFEGQLNITLNDINYPSKTLHINTGKGNDTIRLQNSIIASVDNINGGEGQNTLVALGNVTIATAGTNTTPVANVTNIHALEIRTGHDADTTSDTVNIDANAFDVLASIFIRNEGQAFNTGTNRWQSVSEAANITLNNLNVEQANSITLTHGTTGNSTITNNQININLKNFSGAADTATVTLLNAMNSDSVFNASIQTNGIERLKLRDNDTESNTIHLGLENFIQNGSSISLQGGSKGQYLNLDSFGGTTPFATIADIPGTVVSYMPYAGYGYANDGNTQSNTTLLARESVQAIAAATITPSNARLYDTDVPSVFYGVDTRASAIVAAPATITRLQVENIDAGEYASNLILRLDEVSSIDSASSMKIASGAGDDTFIFDAIATSHAGLTSGDSILAGTGTDTLIIDGNTLGARISHTSTAWSNLKGIDVLRFGTNEGVTNVGSVVAHTAGAYHAQIDNHFVSQTDNGSHLTIINNDGDLLRNTESDLVLDLRGLSTGKTITFIGANAMGSLSSGTLSSNRILLDDTSTHNGQILNGGDSDLRDLQNSAWSGYAADNNNVLQVFNTAKISINDLSNVKNFSHIEFTNDTATTQKLTLTLDNTVLNNLVDASRDAKSAATAKVLHISATDHPAMIRSDLEIDASQLAGFHALNIQNSTSGNDVITLSAHAATASTLALGGGRDTLILVGAANNIMSIDLQTGTNITLSSNNGNVAHQITSLENIDLGSVTGLAAGVSIRANDVGSEIVATQLDDTLISGLGADLLHGGKGNDTFVFSGRAVTQATSFSTTDTTTVNIDRIADFTGSSAALGDVIQLGIGVNAFGAITFTTTTVASVTATTIASANNFAALFEAAEIVNAGTASDAITAQVYDITVSAGNLAGRYFIVNDGDAPITVADTIIALSGVNTQALDATDFAFV